MRCSAPGAACAAAQSGPARGGQIRGTLRSRPPARPAGVCTARARPRAASTGLAPPGRCARRPGPQSAGRHPACLQASTKYCLGGSRRAGAAWPPGRRLASRPRPLAWLRQTRCASAKPCPAAGSRRPAAGRGWRSRSSGCPAPAAAQRARPRPRCGCAPESGQSIQAPTAHRVRAGARRGAATR